MTRPSPTRVERTFAEDELIVSKTDPQGRILYANEVFMRVSGYTETETLGRPHSFVRHPDMPRAMFGLVWHTLGQGKECFAFVNNLAKNGDNYWVFAHMTPDISPVDGTVLGFHSSRRAVRPATRDAIVALYSDILDAERRAPSPSQMVEVGLAALHKALEKRGQSYEEMVFSLF